MHLSHGNTENRFPDGKVDELEKTIAVAARDPSWYGIDEAELDKRRRWTGGARTQVSSHVLMSLHNLIHAAINEFNTFPLWHHFEIKVS